MTLSQLSNDSQATALESGINMGHPWLRSYKRPEKNAVFPELTKKNEKSEK